jgi:streptogramin lyase
MNSAAPSRPIRELGIPVKSISWVRLHPGRTADARPSLLATMGQNNGGCFVLDIDVETGHCRKYASNLPHAEFPISAIRSLRTGILWVGSAWCGHLHRFDPAHPERGFEDLGEIDPGNVTFPTGIAEAPDGRLYIGGSPGCTLTRYDPTTGEFTRFGRLDPVDKYLYPLAGDDGTIAAQVKTMTFRMVAFDPMTGEHRQVGPILEEPTGKSERYEFFKGDDGYLYLDSYAGAFQIRGREAIPVTTLPPPMAGVHATYKHSYQVDLPLPDGTVARFADAANFMYRRIAFAPVGGGAAGREITLDWEGDGTEIFLLHLGPDRRLYGSSMLPEHLWSCDLDGANMVDHGQVSLAGGEAYSMCNYGDKLAVASYPATRLSLYDPAQPYCFGTGPGSNPLDVGRADGASTRPHAMITTPDGKLWVGSAADYGLWHGTLAWFDPATAARGTFRELMPDATPFVLLWLEDRQRILIGFISETGTGTTVRLERGAFGLWDPATQHMDYLGDFGDADLVDVCSLICAGDGLVYAISGRNPRLVTHYGAKPAPTRLLLVDPAERRVIAAAPLPEEWGPLPFESGHILRADDDGTIYGATTQTVFRLKPGTVETEVVARITDGDLTVMGPVTAGALYFATNWRVRSVGLR